MSFQVLPRAARRTRFITAGYDRLIVTYSAREDAVCLLCPPGQDPCEVLDAARLVLRDEIYQELIWYLRAAPGRPGHHDAPEPSRAG